MASGLSCDDGIFDTSHEGVGLEGALLKTRWTGHRQGLQARWSDRVWRLLRSCWGRRRHIPMTDQGQPSGFLPAKGLPMGLAASDAVSPLLTCYFCESGVLREGGAACPTMRRAWRLPASPSP